MNALVYLLIHQWKGAVRNLFRSGARTLTGILGAGWIVSQIFQSIYIFSKMQSFHPNQSLFPMKVLQGGFLFALLVPSYSVISRGLQGGLVAFNAGDVDFLFSMPLRQRLVLGFRLALDSLQILGMMSLATLWLSPLIAGFLAVSIWDVLWRMILGLSLCFVFLLSATHAVYIFYHYKVKASELLSGAVKMLGVLAAVGLASLLLSIVLQGGTPWQQAARFFAHPVIRTLFLPLSLTVDAVMAANPHFAPVTLRNLLILFGMAACSVTAVLGQKENVYEPSLPGSLRRIRFREAIRSGGLSALRMEMLRERSARPVVGGYAAPFFGTGWRAFLWKNLQVWLRAPWLSASLAAFIAIGIPILLRIYIPVEHRSDLRYAVPLFWVYAVWILGITVVQQVRNELSQGAFLKVVPVPAWKIVLYLVAFPVVAFSLTLWVFDYMMWVLFPNVDQTFLLPMSLVLPPMMLSLALFHSLVALLYPRQKDPLHKLLSGLILLPGWGLLIFSPLILAGFVSGMVLQSTLGPRAYESIIIYLTLGMMAWYGVLSAVLLWLNGLALGAYSPADE